jgi:hypothetical protein
MTETTEAPIRLTAEDVEFVVRRPYLAHHACGTSIIADGNDMHAEIVKHTAACDWKEPS